MKTVAEQYKPVQLIAPQLATSTVTGTGVSVISGAEVDAVAVVNLGAIAGTPDTTSCIVTIEESATVNGTYTTNTTFATATAGSQIGTKQIVVNRNKPFIRAKATLAFSGGTSPSIAVSCTLLVKQIVSSTASETALA